MSTILGSQMYNGVRMITNFLSNELISPVLVVFRYIYNFPNEVVSCKMCACACVRACVCVCVFSPFFGVVLEGNLLGWRLCLEVLGLRLRC